MEAEGVKAWKQLRLHSGSPTIKDLLGVADWLPPLLSTVIVLPPFRSINSGVAMNPASHFFSSLALTCFWASRKTGVRGLAGSRPPYPPPPAATT